MWFKNNVSSENFVAVHFYSPKISFRRTSNNIHTKRKKPILGPGRRRKYVVVAYYYLRDRVLLVRRITTFVGSVSAISLFRVCGRWSIDNSDYHQFRICYKEYVVLDML